MTHVKYQTVNAAWPDAMPELTRPEVIPAAKRLWRMAMDKPCPYRIVLATGERAGRYPMRRGRAATLRRLSYSKVVLIVSERYGWRGLVHSLSHRCHSLLWPGAEDHDNKGRHAFLEKSMISHVVQSGWLDGKLKRPDKPVAAADIKAVRHQRVLKRIVAWTAKRKRAERALQKLTQQRAYYERALA